MTGGAHDPGEDARAMTLLEHLGELRTRLVRAALALVVGFFVAWNWHIQLFSFLSAPVRRALADNGLFAIKALHITESIEVYLKVSLVGGLFLASPLVFWQIWAFVSPGLLRHEKRLIVPVVFTSAAFFTAGAAFCYTIVLPFMTDFLVKMTLEAPGLSLEPTLEATFGFSLLLLVAFGVVFELPLFIFFLALLDLVSAGGLIRFFRYWIVISFVIGAILTPTPDPINQTLMSLPLVVLYLVGVGVAWLVGARREAVSQGRGTGAVWRKAVAIVALIALLLGSLAWGVVGYFRTARDAIDDVPASATLVAGLHVPTWRALKETTPAALQGVLEPLGLLDLLGATQAEAREVLLVRLDPDPAALVVRLDEGAQSLVDRVGDATGGRAEAFLGFPGRTLSAGGRDVRVLAVDTHLMWIGPDAALSRLALTREGREPALVDEAGLRDHLQTLRATGPIWQLTAGGDRAGTWLPAGALASGVKWASRVLGDLRDPSLLTTYQAEDGPRAYALRDRLDGWVADMRATSKRTAQGVGGMSESVRALAAAVKKASRAQAALVPAGSEARRALDEVARDVARLEIALAPQPDRPVEDPLARALQGDLRSEVQARSTQVLWTLRGELGRLVALLGMGSDLR